MKATVKQGDYSFQGRSSANKGRIIAGIGLLVLFLSLIVSTQYFAYTKGRGRLPGGLSFANVRVYTPWQLITWIAEHRQRGGSLEPFSDSLMILGGGSIMGIFIVVVGSAQIRKQKSSGAIDAVHGSARWATREQITAASLLPPKGKHGEGVYVGGWVDPKDGQQYYLRHNGKEHILVFAPTRSGKGVGLVLPTLLTKNDFSVVNLDIKGENWALTSGYRQSLGHKVLRWDPTDAVEGRSVTYNPIEELRIGTPYEVGDIMNVAGILVNPDGKGGEDHWSATRSNMKSVGIAA